MGSSTLVDGSDQAAEWCLSKGVLRGTLSSQAGHNTS